MFTHDVLWQILENDVQFTVLEFTLFCRYPTENMINS